MSLGTYSLCCFDLTRDSTLQVLDVARQHAQMLDAAAAELYQAHMRRQPDFCPMFDVHTALEVLSTGALCCCMTCTGVLCCLMSCIGVLLHVVALACCAALCFARLCCATSCCFGVLRCVFLCTGVLSCLISCAAESKINNACFLSKD